MNRKDYFMMIPKVDHILKEKKIQELCEIYGKGAVLEEIRDVLDQLREIVRTGEEEEVRFVMEHMLEKIAEQLRSGAVFPFRRVFNATGILLHTNLGRAPLGKVQIEAVAETMRGFSNLEYNLETGKRGRRWEHYVETITRVTGAEGAIAVNNNAAAVTLMLSVLGAGKEVLVSRGELIEIGGRFRIPEVMEQSGAVLREVGTTNRTRISDYERAITEETGILLKVHTSNYKIVGFTEEASVEELAELGRRYHLPVIVDLGSGVLVDLERFGLDHEPTVQEVLKKGADLVSFSGDKLLGGPQAGIIAGNQKLVRLMENHPLMRAMRLDKCTIAALAATFREYLDEDRAIKNIPVLTMLARSVLELRGQAEELCEALENHNYDAEFKAEPSTAMLGGGALPAEEVRSYAVTVRPYAESCEKLAEKLRGLPIPVIAHRKDDKIWLDMRTILLEERREFKEELEEFFLADACGNRTHPGRG